MALESFFTRMHIFTNHSKNDGPLQKILWLVPSSCLRRHWLVLSNCHLIIRRNTERLTNHSTIFGYHFCSTIMRLFKMAHLNGTFRLFLIFSVEIVCVCGRQIQNSDVMNKFAKTLKAFYKNCLIPVMYVGKH